MKQGIPKNVVWLGFVSLFNDVASEMIYPIVPLFLTVTLGAPMTVVGLIEGIAEATASFLKVFSGWFSDLIGQRKPLAVAGYGLGTIAKLMLYLSFSWPLVLFGRFVDRLGKGVRVAPRDALIADSTPKEIRGAVFGFHRSMDTFGAVCGPLIAIGLLALFTANYRLIFLISFLPALVGVLVLQFFVTEAKPKAATKPKVTLAFDNFGRQYYSFLIISLVFALGNSSDVFLILRAKDLGLPAILVIFAYVIYNVFYALFSYPAGVLADRFGFKKVLIAGFLIFAAVYAGFGLARSSLAVWFLFAIYGFYIAFTEGVGKAYISNIAPPGKVATAIGLYYTVTGAAVLLASVAAGWLWSTFGAPATFYYGALTALLASVLFAGLALSDRRRQD
ncbi:MAG: MFS transporter [Candidatus Saganbacteria bacterium]|nr:MFS transporter [Candidatus Saganbacteria bacterium]